MPGGVIRVSMPIWLPYSRGILFAKQKEAWLTEQLARNTLLVLSQNTRIGKNHYLVFEFRDSEAVSSRISREKIIIRSNQPFDSKVVQDKAAEAAERALKKEALELFTPRIEFLAKQHGFRYKQIGVKKMRSRWGSCSSRGVIALSTYLVQLPWPLIDYVIVHELLHTRHMHHGPKFWQDFESIIPNAKKIRGEVNKFKPQLLPNR